MKKIYFLFVLCFSVTALTSTAQYCLPTYNNDCSSGDYINDVTFGSISNLGTGCANTVSANYSDYTSLSTSIAIGNAYPITASPGPTWGQYFVAFIDLNQDSDFDDAGEFFDIGYAAGGGSVNSNITIPLGALAGNTTMRIMCRFGTTPITQADVCGSPSWGEIEEYTVNILPPAPIDLEVSSLEAPSFPTCELSAAEDITIMVINAGTNDTANFDLSYQINGGTVVMENITTTLPAGDTLIHTFSTSADLSSFTSYNINSWVDLTNDNNANNDTSFTVIVNNTNPTVDLGNDTSICTGVNLTLDASASFISYTWNDGSTNQTLVVNSPSTYSVTATDVNGCAGSDDIVVAANSFTPPSLGSDTTICDGTMLVIDAGTYDSYLWSNTSTDQMVTAMTPGSYSVTVTELSTSCTASATISVAGITPTSTFSIPTTFCTSDDAITLTASPYGGTFSGVGITDSVFTPSAAGAGNFDIIYDYGVNSLPPYTVNQSGTFAPISGTGAVVNTLGDDDITSGLPIGFNFEFFGVVYNQFYISSNGFISFQDDGSGCCTGDVIPSAGNVDNFIAYSWTDMNPGDGGDYDYFTVGLAPNRILVVNVNNLSFYDNTGGVPSATTQILLYEGTNIIEIHSTDIQLNAAGNETTMGIESADGTAGIAVPGRNSSYWSATNDFVQFIPGQYVTCYNADTINVDVYSTPILEFGMDTSICDPSVYTLDAGNSGSNYIWQDASTSQTFDVDTTGQYSVTVTDASGNCVAIDTINITDVAAPVVDLGGDTTICIGESLTLDASLATATYLWSTGETTPTINVSASGLYSVSVTKCATSVDMISVTVAQLPTPDLGPDQLVCWNDTVTLDAGSYASFLWPNGSTNQTFDMPMPICEYTLEMYDSYGDGWNGSTFDLYADGSLIASETAPDAGLTTGSGPHFASIPVSDGTMLSINHDNSGAFQSEVSYMLYDGFGNLVYSVAAGTFSAPATNLWSAMVSCPTEDVSVVVTDINGCTGSDSVNVQFSNPMLDLGPDTAVCDGYSYTVDAGMHTSYMWSDGSTNQTLGLTTAGTYYVTVTDSIGCTKVDSIMFGINALPTVDLGNDTSICAGSTFMIDAGAGMSMYNWQDGFPSQMYAAMNDGTYSVTVTDGNGCMNADTIEISTISVLVAISTTDASCGNSDGEVSALASAGMLPYSYMWNNSSTDANTTGLYAGLYGVTATDNYGCEGMASVNVVNADGPQVTSTTVTPNLCNGDSDGMIEIEITGGVSAYTYMWSNGETTMNVSGLTAGNYDVTVTDNNGCDGFIAESLIDPSALTVATTINAVGCNAGSDGMLSAMAMGGTSPYNYVWDNSATTPGISGLMAGDYSYTTTDFNGCVASTTVTLGEPSALTLTASSTDATCNGTSNGSAMVSLAGGTLFYDYMWSNGATDAMISGLGVGSYDVTVTDGNGCIDNASVSISEPAMLTSSLSITDATCGNFDGGISASISGGTTPYFYNWSNGGSSSSISSVAAGTYSVTVSDNNGCMIVDGGTVINSNGPSVVIVVTDPSCNGASDGTALANINGGTTPYGYSWNNGSTDALATGLIAGGYQVTVADNGGCLGYASETLVNPTIVSVTATSTDETFAGGDNGTATASGMGGTGAFTYAWSNGGTDAMISGLTPNSYSVTASDANGCNASTTVSVAASTITCSIAVNATATDATCNADLDGTATATVSGALGAVTYDWSNGDNSAMITGLSAATYDVTVTDSLNCSASATVTVSEPTALFITLGPDSTVCQGTGMTLDPGAGFSSYAWSTLETTQAINVTTTDTYSVTVTNASGCSASDDVVVTATTCGGVDEVSDMFGLTIYPNPTKGEFVLNIAATVTSEALLNIYSVDGKLIYTENLQLNSGTNVQAINLKGIATGVYSVEVVSDSQASVNRLIVE